MCRIAGIIYHEGQAEQADAHVQAMTDIQAHGGPDGSGIAHYHEQRVVLGHRRLSVIDLEGGHQPMLTPDDSLCITFNGEVYNYAGLQMRLKQTGHTFRTASDTEVILNAYRQWGTASFGLLQGMFAFALHDRRLQKVYLVRDSSGIKPLYWARHGSCFGFASETRALATVPYFAGENPDWRALLLAFGHIPEPFTRYLHIRALRKGHFMEIDLQNGHHPVQEYKQADYEPKTAITKSEAENRVTGLLEQAVKRHLVADVPVGVFLSGGIDSAIISLLAGRLHQNELKTLSVIFRETDFSERKYQLQVAALMHSRHHECLITANDLNRHFSDIVNGMDQPTTDGINTWFISRAARETGLKVVLSGLGGDELFGGYPSFGRIHLVKKMRRFPARVFSAADRYEHTFSRAAFLSCQGPVGDYLFLRGFFSPATIARLLDMPLSAVYDVLHRTAGENTSHTYDTLEEGDRAAFVEYNLYMQNQLLRDSDCMSMQHGVELRVPFLDQDLVREVSRFPADVKFSGQPKSLLTSGFSRLLPENFINRPKMGFSFPLQEWMRRIEPIREMAASHHTPLSTAMKAFQKNKLHWSKAFALYHVFR